RDSGRVGRPVCPGCRATMRCGNSSDVAIGDESISVRPRASRCWLAVRRLITTPPAFTSKAIRAAATTAFNRQGELPWVMDGYVHLRLRGTLAYSRPVA